MKQTDKQSMQMFGEAEVKVQLMIGKMRGETPNETETDAFSFFTYLASPQPFTQVLPNTFHRTTVQQQIKVKYQNVW